LPCGPEKIDTLLLAMNAEIESLKKEWSYRRSFEQGKAAMD
jgi:hypothetical protein